MSKPIVILGVFVADASFRADRQPEMGETILGKSFALGPGGKGSNQAVAAARVGGDVHFITRLGQDTFGDMALDLWRDAGVNPAITRHGDNYTGAAYIFLDAATGDNAIIICPGVAGTITADDLIAQSDLIKGAGVFMTQLESPVPAARAGLQIARDAGVTTILNPAPAADLDDGLLALCDWITPNESEAEGLTGVPVHNAEDAGRAAEALLARGVGSVIITLGAQGVLVCHDGVHTVVPALSPGPVVETTGAGDAFNGAFATALARGDDPIAAARFGCAVAGISVTRAGAAASMPTLAEVTDLLA
ncbi:ribokinase [Oceaniglobus ichthyenteri]|uniref:ribokinase n=1 Tax=Oceaniglobus ichthyenteri TaxID=2136177 RepID=UPI000D37011B|nr:ribokinase [Oceaniglobus ichthyenteri]